MRDLSHINTHFITFSEQNSVAEVMDYFKKTDASHSFIIDENQVFIGAIAYKELLTVEEQQQKLKDIRYLFQYFYAEKDHNEMDLLSLFITNEATILPVTQRHKIIGVISLTAVLEKAKSSPVFDTTATSLLISKEVNDYTMSEVVQIIENYNGKALGVFLTEIFEAKAYVFVKCKTKNINELLQAFRRYEYQIISRHQEDIYLEDVEENSKYLEKYLSF